MRKESKCLLALLLLSALIAPLGTRANAMAPSISGTWKCEIEFDNGRKGTPTFTFKQVGEKLSGTYKGGLGEASLSGTVKGSDVTFTFKAKVPNGAEQQEITVTFIGKVGGDGSMKGTVKATSLMPPGKWTAKKEAA